MKIPRFPIPDVNIIKCTDEFTCQQMLHDVQLRITFKFGVGNRSIIII